MDLFKIQINIVVIFSLLNADLFFRVKIFSSFLQNKFFKIHLFLFFVNCDKGFKLAVGAAALRK